MQSLRHLPHRPRPRRPGQATLDFVLVVGTLFTLSAMVLFESRRIIRAVYQFTCTFISWPFM